MELPLNYRGFFIACTYRTQKIYQRNIEEDE
jgi:hypothetical protein